MKLTLSRATLGGKRLFIGTPMYDYKCLGPWHASMMKLKHECDRFGVRLRQDYKYNESLIPRARNSIADIFRASNFTYFLFIDADIEFRAEDVLAMLALSDAAKYPVLCGAYPKKELNFKALQAAPPELTPYEYSSLATSYVVNFLTEELDLTGPAPILESGTGLMLIHRSVFDKLDTACPEIRYCPVGGERSPANGSYICAFFQSLIGSSEDRVAGKPYPPYLSEDYYFCRLCRRHGIPVHWCAWTKTIHYGTHGFAGDVENKIKYQGGID